MSQPASPGSGAAAAGRRLAVLGMGQLGGSLALASRAAGYFSSVVGFGRRVESLERARGLGLCDRITTSAAEAVADAAVVVLATPLRAIPAIVKDMARALRAGTLVIDVGSVKGTAARDIEALLPSTVDFVACHPLAGTEQAGPDAARGDLFQGRRCLLCPTARTAPAALQRARGLWEAVGAEVVIMEAELHDRVMAAISHLPHVAAFALAGALGQLPPEVDQAARALPTTSFRDTSRVAASSATMWTDIFLENRSALRPMLQALSHRLSELTAAIDSGDERRILELLEDARTTRARLIPE